MHLRQLKVAAIAILAASCSPTKPGPLVPDLTIQSVTPSTGPATGGTELTIRGAGFAAGITVTIGGRPATDVAVRSADTVTAKTPTSPTAGPSDVVVALSGRTQTLTGGFRYDPIGPNTAPVLKSITAQGKRLRQPSNFADYGETIVLTAVVEDAQPALLKYEWQPCDGTVTGSGAQVDWKAPSGGSLPSNCTIGLTVSDGPRVVIGSLSVRLHNSVVEVGALALEFLEEFANSLIPAETTVRNFSDSCASGKAAELKDVTHNRATRFINSHIYGTPAATVAFGSACRGKTADACVVTAVEWNSTVLATKATEIAKGTSTISAVYRDSKWALCESSFDGASSLGLHFMH